MGKSLQKGMFVQLAFHELAMIYTWLASKVTHPNLSEWLIFDGSARWKKNLKKAGYFLRGRVLTSNSFIHQTKKNTMKKLLLVLAVGAFVACNNSGSSESTTDSTTKSTDTASVAPMPADTTHAMGTDTTGTKKDSTKK